MQRRSVEIGCGLQTQKKKYVVLHSGGNGAGPRLEYYDTEKKYRNSGKANRCVLLQSCIKYVCIVICIVMLLDCAISDVSPLNNLRNCFVFVACVIMLF